jgi:hypothetical protein
MTRHAVVAILTAGALAASTAAADAQIIPRAPQEQPIALTGGTIHTVTNGVIENGTIVFVGGRITAVGADVPVPPGAQVIDITGKHVFPGLVDAFSTVGLTEIGGFDQATDLNELGDINPNVHAEVAVNPESRHIGTTRSNGVLVTVASPSGGLISGMAAAMMLEGWTWEEMTIKSEAGLIVNWPSAGSNGYADDVATLTETFATARAYADLRQSPGGDEINRDPRWEAMIPIFSREVPVIINANDVRQIEDAVAWAEDENLRMILRGGADAWYVADMLAEKQVPVLLTSVIDGPNRSWEPLDGAYGQPRRLHEAGVRFAITGSTRPARRWLSACRPRRRSRPSHSTRRSSSASTTGSARCGKGSTPRCSSRPATPSSTTRPSTWPSSSASRST